MPREGLLRSALWLSLGSWVGSWAFFAFVVSRVAFQVLPGNVAGDLAGTLLTTLYEWGTIAAFVTAGTAFALGRRGWLVWVPLGLALVCLFSHLWLLPEIAAVRPSTVGEASTIATGRRFQLLHRLSLGLFMAVHFASILLVVAHARLDAREDATARGAGKPTPDPGR